MSGSISQVYHLACLLQLSRDACDMYNDPIHQGCQMLTSKQPNIHHKEAQKKRRDFYEHG